MKAGSREGAAELVMGSSFQFAAVCVSLHISSTDANTASKAAAALAEPPLALYLGCSERFVPASVT
jgi:hypothetical protein